MWVTVAIVVLLIALILRYTGRPKGLPPGPTCYPIIGNVGLVKPSEAVQAHRNLRKKYGDIYTIMTFHKPMIAVHGYDNIRELLVKHGDTFSDRPLTIINGVFNKGKGLVWSSGPLWKEQRTFALTTMRKFGFGKRCLQDQIMEEVDCFMEELEKYENKPFDIQNILKTSVSNVICSLLFGKRFEYEDTKFKRLVVLLNKLFATGNASSPAFIFPVLRHLPMSRYTTVQNIFADIDGFTSEIIAEHRRNFDGNNINDFIDGFLLEQNEAGENSTFTDEQLKISVREFFAAGTETTSTTIRWSLLFLLHHPEWQQKLRDIIDAGIGQSQPKMEHKEQLPLVEAFILEVQRHANLVPLGLPHAPKEDFHYKGYHLPKGTFMFFALDSVMTDPEIFPEPTKFKPERFLDNDGKCNGEQKERLIPFSTGRRLCLGDSLAKMELFLFLTRLLQKFEIKPEKSECLPSLEGKLGITNMPAPFDIVLIKR
ncbi:cytochrome P450 2C14-like [Crassostrea angulata]|uniref:cytochrome P450 2C14-like n=1 Tax=Magallana angulata TaxID=2784310 RepID=UPI0022B0D86E|nr:cytochrome P450 2C14-like [Crassostrea angulata]